MTRSFSSIVAIASFILTTPAVGRAATVEDLYQAQTILTGQGEEGRPQGFAECLRDVLVKVSGDPRLLNDVRVTMLEPQAGTLVRSFRYRDRMEGLPVHDEQGTRDRPYDLTCDFYPDRIDAVLRSFDRKPWPAERPRVAVFLAVRNIAASYLFADDTRRDNGQRDSLLRASYRLGIPVAIPTQAELQAAGLDLDKLSKAEPASLAAATRALGADIPLVGSMRFSNEVHGWIADWRLAAKGRTYKWQVRGVNFDEAFRSAMRGAAQILSGNGAPGS
ncbi:MAG TPA: DUF2066 domain-containing protein [Alphaproteobacteria bacterium]|nr:DUF2066 domain-containing protein [Alphaproteobacteria bacterium]